LSTKFASIIVTILLVGVLLVAFTRYYSLASDLASTESARGGKGYVSDEVWYVSSARNILRKVFKVNVSPPDRAGASVIFSDPIGVSKLEAFIEEHGFEVKIVDTGYSEINAVYFEAEDSHSLKVFVEALTRRYRVEDVVWGWRIPDAEGINNYMNLEHPPLGKYVIGVSMLLYGDHPLAWRYPSIVAGVLIVLFTYLVMLKLTSDKWLSLVVSLLVSMDPIMRALSSTALLDIYVALFTTLSLYFLVARKLYIALVVSIAGSTFKFNTLFTLIPIWLIALRKELKAEPTLEKLMETVVKLFLVTLALFMLFQVIVSIPLIAHIGFNAWVQQSIIGAFKWHASIKCTGSSCPISSTPWEWFLGVNGFPLYYFSQERALVAMGFWPIWTIALSYATLLLPAYRVNRKLAPLLVFFLGTLLGYVFLWLIGGKTQYSFYSVQFAPLVYMLVVLGFVEVILKRDKLGSILYSWILVLRLMWRALLKLLVIE